MDLADASVLVTGGTGSFGIKFVELLLRFFIGDARHRERLVRAGFRYASDTNPRVLTAEEMRSLVDG